MLPSSNQISQLRSIIFCTFFYYLNCKEKIYIWIFDDWFLFAVGEDCQNLRNWPSKNSRMWSQTVWVSRFLLQKARPSTRIMYCAWYLIFLIHIFKLFPWITLPGYILIWQPKIITCKIFLDSDSNLLFPGITLPGYT